MCGSVTGAKFLSSKKLLSEPDVYCPPNSQFVFIEKARSVGCSRVRVMPPATAISGSAATPAPIRLACSTVRREIRRLAAVSRSPALSSALPPAGSPARGGSPTPSGCRDGPGRGSVPGPPGLSDAPDGPGRGGNPGAWPGRDAGPGAGRGCGPGRFSRGCRSAAVT